MRSLIPLSATIFVLGLACTGADTAPKTFSEASFTCCSSSGVDSVLGEYLDVQRGLASGTAPKGDVTALWAAAGRANASGVESAAAAIKDKDVATMRAGFGAVSREVKKLVSAHKGGGSTTIAWVTCGGKSWYQSSSAINNPYGTAGCGEFQ